MNKALLMLILAVPLKSPGQTNNATVSITNEVTVSATNSATVLVTNWISGDFLRVVGGKVYDNRSGSTFVTFPSSPSRVMRESARVDDTSSVWREEDVMVQRGPLEVGPISRTLTTRPNIYRTILFLNVNPTSTRTSSPTFRAMPVGMRIFMNHGYMAYDCGVEYKGSIPIVSRVKSPK